MKRLLDILSVKRPHSASPFPAFVETFLYDAWSDNTSERFSGQDGTEYAVAVIVEPESKTLFSCHLDTVHRTAGTQEVKFDEEFGLAYKSGEDQECLGGDDGGGVWLMLEMIDAKVPGTYIFHFGEEVGGIGSTGMAKDYADWLGWFDRAVAFDRKGTTDVITHQGSRCCSDDFALELASRLNAANPNLSMKPDDGGIFTDTANYTRIIPECTNISIGYEHAHGPAETLDTAYLVQLRDACISMDWESLPTVRDKNEVEHWASMWGTGFSKPFSIWERDDQPDQINVDEVKFMRYSDVYKLVKNSGMPELAELICDMADRICELEDAAYYTEQREEIWNEQ